MLLPARHAREGALERREISKQGRTFVVVSSPRATTPMQVLLSDPDCLGWRHRRRHLRHTHSHILLDPQIPSTVSRRKESKAVVQR
jgi:hypothetical protein